MKKIFTTIILCYIISSIFSQTTPIVVLNKSMDIKEETFHIRAYKGEILWIHIKTEERKGKRTNTLNNVKVYRQNASDAFQYIVDKNDVDELSVRIQVPSDGIYTIYMNRGGLRRFETNLVLQRDPEENYISEPNRKAVLVSIPDTVHTYQNSSIIYDYVRTATPKIKKARTPQYMEDQVFMDISYALRIDNKFVIPVQLPVPILTDFKIAKSLEWGFTLSVGDEVYKALQKRVAQVATAALDAGVGKALSGTPDKATGAVSKSKVTKAYEVFDHASNANAVASITGDIGKESDSKGLTVASEAVQVMTGFTGLTELAGNKIAGFTPKIGDKVNYEILTQTEYRKYLNKEPYQVMAKGSDGYAQGLYEIRDHRENYYIIIENNRKTSGGAMDVIKSVGKTILSQYVYVNIKVFVNRIAEVTYDKGYFETSYHPLNNPYFIHTENISSKNIIIFEDEIQPQYNVLRTPNIY